MDILASFSSCVIWPLLTYRNSPPAAYWTMEKRVSPFWMDVLEWTIRAEGMRMVKPAGKSTVKLNHRTRWPPLCESKRLRGVIEHHDWAKLPSSVCGCKVDWKPMLMDQEEKTPNLSSYRCRRDSSALISSRLALIASTVALTYS